MGDTESGEGYEIVEEDGEQIYKVKLPELSPSDRQFIDDVLDRTIRELSINLDAISDQETKKGKLRDEVLKMMLGEIDGVKSGVKQREGFEAPDDKKLAQIGEIIIDNMT